MAFQSIGLNVTSALFERLPASLAKIDVEGDDFVLLVAETHRREVVVETDDDRRGRCGSRQAGAGAGAGSSFLPRRRAERSAGRQRAATGSEAFLFMIISIGNNDWIKET